MSTDTLLVLREARRLIERGWCQKAFARDRVGAPVEATSKEAVQWCARGAIKRASLDLDRLAQIEQRYITFWNDAPERTQEEVLAEFDRVIALAEKGIAQ